MIRIPIKNKTKNSNQLELNLFGKKSKKKNTNQLNRKRRFPIEKIQQRLIRLKNARAKRIVAEEAVKEYHTVIRDIQHRFGKVNSSNAKNYIKQLQEEQKKEEALATSFKVTGTDKDMVERHENTAEHIHRYADALRRHFKIK